LKNNTDRYHWLDVFKAIAIFFVIYYHLASNTFTVYLNAFIVQPFFFASGVTASHSRRLSMAEFAVRRFRQIMVPYAVFGLLSMSVKYFTDKAPLIDMARQLLLGKRTDMMFAVTLWFLPCLFIMSIIYHLLVINIRYPFVRLVICAAISFVFRLYSEGNMLPWGADNAIRFLVYYGLGDFASSYVNKVSTGRLAENKLFTVVGFASMAVSALHYKRGYTFLIDVLGFPQVYLTLFMSLFMCAVNAIVMYTFISVLLQKSRLLQTVGKATLSICCMQTVSDKMFAGILSLLGISFAADTWLKAVLLSVVLVAISVAADIVLRRLVPGLYGQHR